MSFSLPSNTTSLRSSILPGSTCLTQWKQVSWLHYRGACDVTRREGHQLEGVQRKLFPCETDNHLVLNRLVQSELNTLIFLPIESCLVHSAALGATLSTETSQHSKELLLFSSAWSILRPQVTNCLISLFNLLLKASGVTANFAVFLIHTLNCNLGQVWAWKSQL